MGDAGSEVDGHTENLLPSPNPTLSYWQTSYSNNIAHHRSTSDLPTDATVVIIGSGISSVFAARQLVSNGVKDIVVLEARGICSGATGRNGGHCQPLVFEQLPDIAKFEIENFKRVAALVGVHRISCEFRTLKGCHAFYSRQYWNDAKTRTLKLQESHPELGQYVELVEAKSRLVSLRIPDAVGAILQSHAASLSPYKLVINLWDELLRKDQIHLHADTPVTSVDKSSLQADKWLVSTPRGTISATHVILTTNGYTAHLLPQFRTLIVPVQGEMSALIPPPTSRSLQTSCCFLGSIDQDRMQDDYLVQRPRELGGELMFGGGRVLAEHAGVNTTDDSYIDTAAAKYLRKMLPKMLDLGDRGAEPKELKARAEWTGIMGYSRDSRPWIGAVPGHNGVWLSAGYTGHGMPNAPGCGIHIANLVTAVLQGRDWRQEEGEAVNSDCLPASYLISEERMRRAHDLPEVTSSTFEPGILE